MTMLKRRRRKRKRNSWNSEFGGSPATSVNFKPRRLEDELDSTANSGNCGCFGSSNEWSDNLLAKGNNKFLDLEKSEEREVTLDLFPNRRDRPLQKKAPSETQLEKFFAAAEKNLHKQFLHKYNYDIVKDRPMEGKYEWVPIHQEFLSSIPAPKSLN